MCIFWCYTDMMIYARKASSLSPMVLHGDDVISTEGQLFVSDGVTRISSRLVRRSEISRSSQRDGVTRRCYKHGRLALYLRWFYTEMILSARKISSLSPMVLHGDDVISTEGQLFVSKGVTGRCCCKHGRPALCLRWCYTEMTLSARKASSLSPMVL